MVETAPLRWKELRVVSGDMSDIKRPAVSMACMAQVPRAKHTRVIGGPGSREGGPEPNHGSRSWAGMVQLGRSLPVFVATSAGPM